MAFKSIKVDEAVAAEFKKLALDNSVNMTTMMKRLLNGAIHDENVELATVKLDSLDNRITMMAAYLEKRFNLLSRSMQGIHDTIYSRVPEFKNKSEEEIPPEMKDLRPDELPACCQSIFADGEPSCEHWKKTFVTEFGERKLGWKNTLTGRTANDEAYYKYV